MDQDLEKNIIKSLVSSFNPFGMVLNENFVKMHNSYSVNMKAKSIDNIRIIFTSSLSIKKACLSIKNIIIKSNGNILLNLSGEALYIYSLHIEDIVYATDLHDTYKININKLLLSTILKHNNISFNLNIIINIHSYPEAESIKSIFSKTKLSNNVIYTLLDIIKEDEKNINCKPLLLSYQSIFKEYHSRKKRKIKKKIKNELLSFEIDTPLYDVVNLKYVNDNTIYYTPKYRHFLHNTFIVTVFDKHFNTLENLATKVYYVFEHDREYTNNVIPGHVTTNGNVYFYLNMKFDKKHRLKYIKIVLDPKTKYTRSKIMMINVVNNELMHSRKNKHLQLKYPID